MTAKADSIRETVEYKSIKREGYEPLPLLAGSFAFLGYDEDDRCFFFQDSHCALHASHGADSKPLICQTYPYNFVDTPDGIFVSLLFSCPSVVAGTWDDGEQSRQEIEALLSKPNLPILTQVKQHILITAWHTMEWPQYLEWQSEVLERWDARDPITCLLGEACSLIESEGRTPASDQLLEKAKETVHQFAGACLDFLEPDSEEDTQWSSRLNCVTPEYTHRIPHSDLERFAITRYVTNQLEGKLLLIGPSLVGRLLLCATAIGIVLHDLEVMRIRDAVRHFDFQHLALAFQTCEERLVSQSNELEPYLVEMEELLVGCD